jgi:hypothetical protein
VVAERGGRRAYPAPPRQRYSWEEEAPEPEPDPEFELPSPPEVPVLWQRPDDPRGSVLPFRPRGDADRDPDRGAGSGDR